MNQSHKQKIAALLRRELQEYRNSIVLTPVVVAGLLIFFMLVSVLVANRITVAGDSVMDILNDEHASGGMNIVIHVDDGSQAPDYVVKEEDATGEADSEEWNFSREWKFNPQRKDKIAKHVHEKIESLNPVLNAMHSLFLLLLLLTSSNYLLGTFHQDRRDRSILFWKSMPVSEGQEVAAKMAVVCLLAPAIYVAMSIVTQLSSVALGMVMTWRLDMSPEQVVLGNIDFFSLFRGQLAGLLIWVLWTVPAYAWLLFCSCAARRSPLMLALAIPLALIVLEQLFFGSDYLETAFSHHVPHPGDEDSLPMGFYFHEPRLGSLDYPGMLLGLLVTAGLLFGAAWFRKHRFEI